MTSAPRAIDWAGIHRRLGRLKEMIERGGRPEPEERHRILQARARALARPREAAPAGGSLEIVEFCIADERYGLETRFIREVCPLAELTRVPCTPPFVRGILNLRGEIVSVVDLRSFFGLPAHGFCDLDKLIVLEGPEMTFAILADRLEGVGRVPLAGLQEGLPTLNDGRRNYLRGVTGERLVILDGGKLLNDPDMVVNQRVEEAGSLGR